MIDIGTPLQAIQYALSLEDADMAYEFLHNWSEGDINEWDAYTRYLKGGKLWVVRRVRGNDQS